MKAMLAELEKANAQSEEHQKYMWEMLRKSINGIVNKVSVSNISHIVLELFNENLLRGRGLFAKAVMKSQQASVSFTYVYCALLGAVNTKLPDVVRLVIHRTVQ
jgi:pre-mRNA-splicing factor CWC22